MPPRTSFETIDCSIARTMAVLGEPWTALILRDLFIGITRFDALHAHIGVSRKVLTLRLSRLVNDEIVVKRAYAQRPERFDYILTSKGWQLCDILLAISAWGDQWTTSEAGPPALLRHRQCDHLTTAEIRCSHCGEPLHAADTRSHRCGDHGRRWSCGSTSSPTSSPLQLEHRAGHPSAKNVYSTGQTGNSRNLCAKTLNTASPRRAAPLGIRLARVRQ